MSERTNCEQDTREQLEADIYRAADELEKFSNGERFLNTHKIIRWLDRQAAITEREVEHDLMLAGRMAVEVERKRIAELTAERDELETKHQNDYDAWQLQMDKLQAERDELQAAIDAMGNGQFYAMYKAKCEECEQLKKVASTQADSFKKLEIELAGKDG